MEVNDFLQKAADKSGFIRERFNPNNIPTNPENVCILPFFGDLRSLCILATLILKRYRQEEKGSKYFIICSYPGFQGFFPYVDEYWGLTDGQKKYGNGFLNEQAADIYRNLNTYFFEDFIQIEDVIKYYNNGFTEQFWKKYKVIEKYLPVIPSSAVLNKDFNRDLLNRGGLKCFVYPMGSTKEFWLKLIDHLLKNKILPVVYKGFLSHDVSTEFMQSCIYNTERDFLKVLSAMRATGCVLDVLNSTSRLAIMARCPYLAVDYRSRYYSVKEYEIDDILAVKLPRKYIFAFPTSDTGFYTFDNIVNNLNNLIPTIDRAELPTSGEICEEVSYSQIREIHHKKLGIQFLKIPRS